MNTIPAIFFVGGGLRREQSSRFGGAFGQRVGINPTPTSKINPGRSAGSLASMGRRGWGDVWRSFLVALILFNAIPAGGWSGEKPSLTASSRKWLPRPGAILEAEIKRDYQTVFRSLYPASEYRKANDFAAYLAEARSTPVHIESYEILRVSPIAENPDRTTLPEVDGLARVEVDVRIRFSDNGQQSLVNYDFPFVRAGGQWYKL